MADRQITPEFIESMVDRIIHEITSKLEQLDISMDYVAAALLDDDAAPDAPSAPLRRRLGEQNNTKQ